MVPIEATTFHAWRTRRQPCECVRRWKGWTGGDILPRPVGFYGQKWFVGRMDIVAHALWTTAAAIPLRQRLRRPINLGWAAFWGVFPVVSSFAIPAVVRIWWYATGVTSSLRPDAGSAQHFQFVWQLYYCSHSLIVFAAVFGVVWVVARRPVLELLGWGLHILIDIPTHQGMFALHFLWPLSSYGISGIRWESRWFMAVNYGALIPVYFWMWVRHRRLRPVGAAVHAGS